MLSSVSDTAHTPTATTPPLPTLAAQLTDILNQAHDMALDTLPLKPPLPPVLHRKSQRPHWPRSIRTDLATLRNRAKLIRHLINPQNNPHNVLPPYPTLHLPPSLRHTDIGPENLPTTLTRDAPPTLGELRRCFRAHQILAKRLIHKAALAPTRNYARAITRTSAIKPRMVIRLLEKRRNPNKDNPQTTLTSIKDDNGNLVTDPQEVIQCLTSQAAATLTKSPSVTPLAPFP